MQQKIGSITNKTMVPLSVVLLVWYSAVWLLEVKNRGEVNAKDIEVINESNKKIILELSEHMKALVRIETILKNLEKRGKDE